MCEHVGYIPKEMEVQLRKRSQYSGTHDTSFFSSGRLGKKMAGSVYKEGGVFGCGVVVLFPGMELE